MSGRTRFWGALAVYLLLVVVALGGVAWQAMAGMGTLPDAVIPWFQRQIALLLLVFFCLGGVLVHIWAWMDRRLLKPLAAVSQAVEIMAHADPLHAVVLEPDHLLGSLPGVACQLGEALFSARRQVKEALANSAVEMERLEKVIKHLNVGLFVINCDGTIVLYNWAAQNLFHSRMDCLGLGRSLYDLCARRPVETTMELLGREKITESDMVQKGLRFFCAVLHDDRMLDCTMGRFVLDQAGQSYFLITFEEVTRRMAALRRSDRLIRQTLESIRGPVANLQAATETLVHYADMDETTRGGLMQVVIDEGKELSQRLGKLSGEANALAAEHWILADVLTSDFFGGLARRLEKGGGPRLVDVGESLWIQADAPALMSALEVMVQNIRTLTGVGVIEAQALMGNNRIYLDFIWVGLPIPETEVLSWHRLELDDGGVVFRLGDVLERHGCEVWSQVHRGSGRALLRMPVAPSPRQWQFPVLSVPERPEFYDFSMMESFASLGREAGRALSGLDYVVFDTETTGLSPSKGDEIISIAGVRIVNGRILSGETFVRLIDPRRAIPAESTRIHGITEADVQGKPTIDEVLPQFRAFVGQSVLVAHNAAFDMRFLQLKEASVGVRFDRPVLDTLLLSVFLHEDATDHTLDAIAGRMGVEIRERHSAMGDALVTAEVFFKLLNLLNAKGITTLGLAMKASDGMVQIRRQQTKANY